jgi:hypothetical protein
MIGDFFGGFLAGESLRFFAGVEGTKIRMANAARHAAAAAVDKGEGTRRGGPWSEWWTWSLQKEDLVLGFLGKPRGGEAQYCTK